MEKKSYDSIDMMKFILSLMVAAIHINPVGNFHGYILPICRTAVPLFFLASGFFLFGKMQQKDKKEKSSILKQFIIRNLLLYVFWFFVLLPINWDDFQYFEQGVLHFLSAFLFGSLFPASWYIMALVIGAVIVFYLSEYIRAGKWVFLFGVALYVLCCLNSNYGGFFSEWTPLKQINRYYPARIVNSFPVSIIWLSIGRFFALRKKEFFRKKYARILLAVSALLFFLEWAMVNKLHITIADDCYFMLVPLCVIAFYLVLHQNITIAHAKLFRNISTVTYCLHFSLAKLLEMILQNLGISLRGFVLYLLVVILCILCTLLLNKIKTIKGFGWVKCAM